MKLKKQNDIKKTVVIGAILLLTVSCNEKSSSKKEDNPQHSEIHKYISDVMRADEIPGLAIAVIEEGKLVHKKNYGYANIEHKVPVSDSTLFRIYSTSKLITAVGVFHLIEQGKLSLKDSISNYLDDLPEAWKSRKIEHLLTHSSGLPDYKKYDSNISDQELFTKLFKDTIHFDPGKQFEYNQTNYWFLQLIIEKVTGQNFEDYIKKNQFSQNSNEVVYASNSLVAIPNRVAKYQYNKKYDAYEMSTFEAGERSHAGNGLNMSLNALITWNSLFDSNQLLNENTKKIMSSPFEYSNEDIFGHGWGIYGPDGQKYYGFAGGGVSALMKFPKQDITIVILSNGFKNRPIISNAITYISGLMDGDLVRKDRMLNEEVRLVFLLNEFTTALALYKDRKRTHPEINFERALNDIGYRFLSDKRIEDAISILKLSTDDHPNSANAFDILAEAYFKKGEFDLAIKNYKKAVMLGGTGGNAKAMIKKIQRLMEDAN